MATDRHIRYLVHDDIDKRRWDECMAGASNGLVYGQSFYLDTMAPQWHALVLNGYEAVMPLPWRRKAGFSYLFQPSMTPILGIFGQNIDTALAARFLEAIPASFTLWDISLNHFNPLPPEMARYVYTRNNFVLSLRSSYDEIQASYHRNITRNIDKATRKGCRLQKDLPVEELIAVCEKQFPLFTRVEPGLFQRLENIYRRFTADIKIYGVRNALDELLAACAFLFYGGRVYYWLVGNAPQNREYGASSLLLDCFIREHARQPFTLDFEGSDHPGVAGFYKGFGAVNEPFHTIYRNRLPFPLNLLKRVPSHYRRLASGLA